MAFSSFSKFLFMASIDWWRVSRSGYLSFGYRKKSQEAKSGEYGGWAMTFVSCLAKTSVTITLECDGALSWWKIDELSAYKSSRLRRIARLLRSFDVIFINPRLVTRNNTFVECRVISYVGKHLFCNLYSTFFLQKIQVFQYESGGDALHT